MSILPFPGRPEAARMPEISLRAVPRRRWIMVVGRPDTVIEIREALSGQPIRVLTASTLEEVDRRMRIVLPDLLLLDMHPSLESGLDIFALVRLRHPQVPVLLLMEPWLRRLAKQAMKAGARGVLFSPLDPSRLSRRIQLEVADGPRA